MAMDHIPRHFCWSKFGTEAGQTIDDIVARKERERVDNGGLFLWGIGNNVGVALRALVQTEKTPYVIFSPILAKPKRIDVQPKAVSKWTRARGLDGLDWPIPKGSLILSRAHSPLGKLKQNHFALVCESEEPLFYRKDLGKLDGRRMVNLLSGAPLGSSQVTSVVEYTPDIVAVNRLIYEIRFTARLVNPYFVELWNEGPQDGAFPPGSLFAKGGT